MNDLYNWDHAITQEEIQKPIKARRAWKRHMLIKAHLANAEKSFLVIGHELTVFEREKQYLDLGYKSFNQYLADPNDGLDMSRSQAFSVMGIYKEYRERLNVPEELLLESKVDKLNTIRSKVELTEENVEDWVADSIALSRSDLRLKLDGKDYVPPGWQDVFVKMWNYGNELRMMNAPQDLMNIIVDFLDYRIAWKEK